MRRLGFELESALESNLGHTIDHSTHRANDRRDGCPGRDRGKRQFERRSEVDGGVWQFRVRQLQSNIDVERRQHDIHSSFSGAERKHSDGDSDVSDGWDEDGIRDDYDYGSGTADFSDAGGTAAYVAGCSDNDEHHCECGK